MTIRKSHILYIPTWYPSPLDIQNGVFIQKHAKAAARHHKITVLFANSAKESYTSCKEDGDLKELITTFKKSRFSFLNKVMLFKHYVQQFRKIKEVDIIHAHVWSNKTLLLLFYQLYTTNHYLFLSIGLDTKIILALYKKAL